MREKTEDYIWLHREDRQTDRQDKTGQARLMIQLEIKVI